MILKQQTDYQNFNESYQNSPPKPNLNFNVNIEDDQSSINAPITPVPTTTAFTTPDTTTTALTTAPTINKNILIIGGLIVLYLIIKK
jgi:hypothetical protein